MVPKDQWQTVDPGVIVRLSLGHKVYKDHCYVKDFPLGCAYPNLMHLNGQKNNYSCSLENVKLALQSQKIKVPDKEIEKVIGLTVAGVDQWPLYQSMLALGVECYAQENITVEDIIGMLSERNSFIITGGQHPDSTIHQLKQRLSGHYMAACCYDSDYIYYADPAFPRGKTRIPHRFVNDLAYDVELETGRLVQGFAIRVPIKR